MSYFASVCGRLAEIVPAIGGDSQNCGRGMILFCRWCMKEFDLHHSESLYVQDVVLHRMTPEEIQAAYARWCIEEGEES